MRFLHGKAKDVELLERNNPHDRVKMMAVAEASDGVSVSAQQVADATPVVAAQQPNQNGNAEEAKTEAETNGGAVPPDAIRPAEAASTPDAGKEQELRLHVPVTHLIQFHHHVVHITRQLSHEPLWKEASRLARKRGAEKSRKRWKDGNNDDDDARETFSPGSEI